MMKQHEKRITVELLTSVVVQGLNLSARETRKQCYDKQPIHKAAYKHKDM